MMTTAAGGGRGLCSAAATLLLALAAPSQSATWLLFEQFSQPGCVQGSGVYLTAVSLALGFSLVLSFWYSLKLAYTSGGFNFGEWVFRGGAQAPYDTMVSKIQEGSTISPGRFIFLALGVAATVGMTFLRHRFSWWRLHPIGFSVASVLQVQWSLLSLFVAWLSKTVLIRYGGLILYNRAKPLFIGLVVGHFTGAGFSFVIDAIWFTGQGHSLYW